jgi:threonine synthase
MAVEPASAVAFAGYEKLVKEQVIRPDEFVVINCTGNTTPVEKQILGDGWGVDVKLDDHPANLQEGLHAALEGLDERTRSVLVIDDNSDDAYLIRRFLEARKAYRVFHAQESWDGLAQARQRLPDLIILDLMMPDMDGFGILEELKYDKRTQGIPVIVVSAKDMTRQDRQRLDGQIEGLYQKGSLPAREFVDQVVEAIEIKGK